ncbi:unnamed protein product [Cuscuta campestris]|uniref:Integrase catalytic domain-containing protein n=1 Tax=Cuscuta campestris TaxID=132261 RepID=A0A484NHP2_9ASTE|nr:unnamed protein product [Cuscuta campestris]
MRVDAPRFSGDDPTGWIFRVQKYFDYFLTPESERLQLVAMLIDHPASEWFHYFQANNPEASWCEFLEAVHQRFDPDYYENYIGLLSKLTQTSTVMEYQAAFEAILNKVSGVPDATLIAMYVAGLKQPLRREVNLRNPSTLQSTFALARELSACHQDAATSFASPGRRPWQSRPTTGLLPTPTTASKPPVPPGRTSDKPPNLPIVRVTNAEKAERNKKGLCWYCEEKWTPGHHCRHRFLVLMGPDDDDNPVAEPDLPDDPLDTAVIEADISSMHSLSGSPSPRSLRLAGMVHNGAVQVLLDSGSTHNFIHPTAAERLALPLHPVSPFRVYVGNGDSLRCTYSCPGTPLSLQGHLFQVDLYMLEIHGPEIVLGIQWLQTLGKVAHDYSQMTMEFSWNGSMITLRGDPATPRPLTYSQFCRLAASPEACELYELLPIASSEPAQEPTAVQFPDAVPAALRPVLEAHADLFRLPQGLPPSRGWDHRIYLAPSTRPINVHPYRYSYFQKTEIERQVKEMLDQGLIRHKNSSLPDIQGLHSAVANGTAPADLSVHGGFLYFRRRFYVSPSSPLRDLLLHEFHSTPIAGHQGMERTFRRLAEVFYWPRMRQEVKRYVASCAVSYHPQSDGQTEVMNRSLEQYLRAFTFERPGKWATFLPWAELALNCSHHAGLSVSPFQALYGRPPPSLFPTLSLRSKDPHVEELLRDRAELLADLKQHLAKMQQRMRTQANLHRREVNFAVGDLVLLKLQPYRQHSLARPLSSKLARRFYGPFEVLERVGLVAYRLRLPEGCRIHNVFHVSLLRPFVARDGSSPVPTLPAEFFKGRPVSWPIAAVDSRVVLVAGESQEQWLVRWSDGLDDHMTWEPVTTLRDHFPDLRLEDKVEPNPGGVDTDTIGPHAGNVAASGRPRRKVGPPRRYEDYV